MTKEVSPQNKKTHILPSTGQELQQLNQKEVISFFIIFNFNHLTVV